MMSPESSRVPASPWRDLEPRQEAPSGTSPRRLASSVRILLLRGGIEQNPGPGKASRQRRRQQQQQHQQQRQQPQHQQQQQQQQQPTRQQQQLAASIAALLVSSSGGGGRSHNSNAKVSAPRAKPAPSVTRLSPLPPSVSYAAVAAGKFRPLAPAPAAVASPAPPTEGGASQPWLEWSPARRETAALVLQHSLEETLAAACSGMAKRLAEHLSALEKLVAGAAEFVAANPRDTPWLCVAAGCPCCFGSERERDGHLTSQHKRLAAELQARYRAAAAPTLSPPDVSAVLAAVAVANAERDRLSGECASWRDALRAKEQSLVTLRTTTAKERHELLTEVQQLRQELADMRTLASSAGLRGQHHAQAYGAAVEAAREAQERLGKQQRLASDLEREFRAELAQLEAQRAALASRLQLTDASLGAAKDELLQAQQATYATALERQSAVAAATAQCVAAEDRRKIELDRFERSSETLRQEAASQKKVLALQDAEAKRLEAALLASSERFKRLARSRWFRRCPHCRLAWW